MGNCMVYIPHHVHVAWRPSGYLWQIEPEYLVSHVYERAYFRYDQINLETGLNQILNITIIFRTKILHKLNVIKPTLFDVSV